MKSRRTVIIPYKVLDRRFIALYGIVAVPLFADFSCGMCYILINISAE